MKKLLICILIIGIIFISGCIEEEKANSEPSNNSQSSGIHIKTTHPYDNNSNADLIRLVERMFTFPGTSMDKSFTILPGELPSDLPIIIPIPEDATIIGSLVHFEDNHKQVQIFLDVPTEPNKILEFYRNNLNKTGWNELESSYPEEGGFVHFPSTSESSTFCQNESVGPSLTIIPFASNGDKPTDVRLNLDTNPRNSVCRMRKIEPHEISGAAEIMPILKPPKGALQKGGGGGGSDDQWDSETTLETELSIRDLESHYQNQLLEARWELKEKTIQGSIGLSTWSFTDEFGNQWSGILLINNLEHENLYFAYFSIFLV